MEKLKEDYISIDTRLEYMEAIAVKYVPDVDIDPATGERYVCNIFNGYGFHVFQTGVNVYIIFL